MSFSNPIPTPTTIAGSSTSEKAFSTLQAKYTDAAAWAAWAGAIVEAQTEATINVFSAASISPNVAAIEAIIAAAPAYSVGSLDFINTAFTDALLTALKAELTTDLGTPSTGLGSVVETAMFDRAVARATAERATAYAEITEQFSENGFDIPTGALTAKQTELNSESSIRLADVDAAILHESATLAANYNVEIRKITLQLITVLGQLNDSQMMRNFEIQKTAVLQSLEGYKAELALYELKGSLVSKEAQLSIEALFKTTTVQVEAFKGIAGAAAQMVSSALNGVNVSSSFGFGGSEANKLNPSAPSVSYGLTGTMADVALI